MDAVEPEGINDIGSSLDGGSAYSVYTAVQNLTGGTSAPSSDTQIECIITGGGAVWQP